MKRKVWLNPWAWFEINDPKALHVSEDLFLQTYNFPKTLENCQKFKEAMAKITKERAIKVEHVWDESHPASN